MKTLQLCFIAFIAISLHSCLEPDPIEEDDLIIEDQLVNSIPSQDEATLEDITSTENEDLIAVEAASLEGLWTSTSIITTGSITTTTDGGAPVAEDFFGVGYDLNHTVSFINVPNLAIGEGIYSLSLEILGGSDDGDVQEILGLSLITSQTFWIQSDDELTFDSGGKIRTATITELTDTNLTLYFEENIETTSQGGSVVQNIIRNTTYEFVK